MNDTQLHRLARAITRRLAAPPSDATREQHLRAIINTTAPQQAPVRQTVRDRVADWFGGLASPRRLVPAGAAMLLLVAVVATPLLRGSNTELPVLSASAGPNQPGIAADTSMERGDTAAPDIMWYPMNYRFVLADGVSLPAGTSPGWQMRIDGSLSQRATDLAARFNLANVQPSEWDRSVLVAGDPEQASITVFPSGEWHFSNYAGYPQWDCPQTSAETPPETAGDAAGTSSDSADRREPALIDEPCTPPPAARDLPTVSAAREQARALFAELGSTDIAFGEPYRDDWTVSVWGTIRFAEIPGYEGHGMSVTYGASGEILSAYGTLARPAPLGEYPTISAADAVARLNSQFSNDGGARILPAPMEDAGDTPVSDTSLPVEPPVDGEIETVEVTLVSVTIVPAMVWTQDGTTAIAPHYRFVADDGGEWWVSAVTDEYLGQ